MSVVTLICCYGLVDNNLRTEVEYQGLQEYFGSCYNYLSNPEIKSQLEALVFCGGYRFSDVSESFSSTKYFNTLGSDLANIPKFLEQTSRSSIQNLALGCLTIMEKFPDSDLLIFCDSNRQYKIQTLAQKLFKNLTKKIEVVSFDRSDIHPTSNPESQKESLEKDLNSGELELWQQILELNNKSFVTTKSLNPSGDV